MMVELIGLVTMSALVWVLHGSMANESDAERRRLTRLGTSPFAEMAGQQEETAAGTRVAA
ncbi:MAG: hypothetical protein EPO61_07130 [Nitrospirae bacterium]|nr:MAG: hypothetical protein EPO61_07130 [Nitrospirota bacterium]